jgi:TonB-dependent siderophore receptor
MARLSKGALRGLLATTILGSALAVNGGLPVPAYAQARAATVAFDIPAQPLIPALVAFSDVTGLQLFFDSALARDLASPGVSGSMAPEAALRRLLAGTGMTYRFTNANTVTLEKAAADGAMTLDPVTVEGSATAGTSPSAVSEGTGSYAARAVTIGKTEQTLREIPQSVSVMTRQQMDDQNMTTVAEALRSAPGVSTWNYLGTSAYARGFSMSTQQNGVQQQGMVSETPLDLAIYDRLEVLRGPSGLLSGSGEPGGSVNYVRKRPLDHLAVSGSASVGSWDNYRGVADVTSPLNESGSIRGRLIAAYADGDTFYDVGHEQKQTAYGAFEFDATPDTTIDLTLMHASNDWIRPSSLPVYSDGTVPGRSAFVGFDKEAEKRYDEVAAGIKHRFDNDWTVRMAAFRQAHDFTAYMAYGTSSLNAATGLGNITIDYGEIDHVLEGVDASVSGPLHMFGQKHEVMFGYNWAGYDQLRGDNIYSLTAIDMLNTHSFPVSTDIASRSRLRTRQSGYYGVVRVKPADPVTVILGGRLSDYSSKSRTEGAGATDWSKGAEADDEFTPYGGVVVDLNKQISVYASYADIFVPQTEMDHTGSVLDPRIGWQAETGIKGAFFNERLNASLAAFRIRDQNRATFDAAHVGCGPWGECYLPAGTVESQGFEAEIGGSPVPGLDLTAAYTYLDSKNKNSGERYGANITPKHLLKLWGHYRFDEQVLDGDLAGWSVGAGVIAQSAIYTAFVRQGAYAVASARVGYDINSFLSASLNVENLFDEKYFNTVGYAGFYTSYGTPRNATLTLTAKW